MIPDRIEDIEQFNTLIKNALRRRGYKYLDEIKNFTYDDLCRIRCIGKKSATTILEVINEKYYPNLCDYE